MKTIFIGDIHGRDIWKRIIEKESPGRVIFLGDYFDSFDIPPTTQLDNFLEIIEYKNNSKNTEVILLIGNHDHQYFSTDFPTMDGYQAEQHFNFQITLNENKHNLKAAYSFGNILCTHAGVSYDFMNSIFGADGWGVNDIPDLVNDIWRYKPLSLSLYGLNPYGNSVYDSPIWIRPYSLMKSNRRTEIKKTWVQVVGHTAVETIDIKGKSTGGRYYFIDSLFNGQYLIYDNNTFSLGKIKK